jgi:hypothetical protein
VACGTILAGAGLLGSLGGAGLQYSAANSERNAMNDAVGAEINRQNAFSNQAKSVFNTSLGQSTPQAAGNQIALGKLASLGTLNNTQLPASATSLPGDLGLGANPGAAAGNATQAAENTTSNQADAAMQGYSNYGLQQYLKDLQAKNQLGVINQNAQGWAGILPYQVQAAQQSQQGMTDIGQLLSALGGAATTGGLGMDSWLGALGNTFNSQYYPEAAIAAATGN